MRVLRWLHPRRLIEAIRAAGSWLLGKLRSLLDTTPAAESPDLEACQRDMRGARAWAEGRRADWQRASEAPAAPVAEKAPHEEKAADRAGDARNADADKGPKASKAEGGTSFAPLVDIAARAISGLGWSGLEADWVNLVKRSVSLFDQRE